MLTKQQLNQLSQNFQIDNVSILREYLQVLFLNYLYRERQAEKIYFKGGTCLHFLYSSPRFSEDLDFSTRVSAKTIHQLLKAVIKNMDKEAPGLKIKFLWQGKKALRYQLHWQGAELKFPLNIRLDFAFEKVVFSHNVGRINIKMPIASFSFVLYLIEEEILAEKIRAFLTRAKGRDIFDLWYLLDRDIKLDRVALKKKLEEVGLSFNKKRLLEKIKRYPAEKIRRDLTKFLPRAHRKILPLLKQKIVERIEKTTF